MFTQKEIELASCFSLDSKVIKSEYMPQHMSNANSVCLGKLAMQANKVDAKSEYTIRKLSEKEQKENNIANYAAQFEKNGENCDIDYNVNYSRWHRAATTFLRLYDENEQ